MPSSSTSLSWSQNLSTTSLLISPFTTTLALCPLQVIFDYYKLTKSFLTIRYTSFLQCSFSLQPTEHRRRQSRSMEAKNSYTLCLVTQSYPTLCNPIDCSLPGSPCHGIFQARILEWVAISSSKGSSWYRDWTCVSGVSCIAGRFFSTEALGKP